MSRFVGILILCLVASVSASEHWSLRPLQRPPVPESDATNPIDAFVRAKLKSEGLKPSPPADHSTLIRRLCYNLIGLSPGELTRHNYSDLVEHLLASPRYGEHWARHWLDVANYADTHGNDHDFARPNAWPYRDWVVQAFNDDKPYTRFIQEQVAGDVLFPDDPQAVVALGFLAAGPWDETLMVGINKDSVDHRIAQNLDRDEYVATVMGAFQGLTVQCARCHDHKFDPVTQKEYYQLQAVFSGIDRIDRTYDQDPTLHRKRRSLEARLKAVKNRDPKVVASMNLESSRRVADRLKKQQIERAKLWHPLKIISITSAKGAKTKFGRQADGSWLVTGEVPHQDTYILTAQVAAQDVQALRFEGLPDKSMPGGGPGRYHPSGNFHFTEFQAAAHPSTGPTSGAEPIKFVRATVSHGDGPNQSGPHAIDGNTGTHWSVHPHYGKQHNAVFELEQPLGHAGGTTLIIRMMFNGHERHLAGRFRLSYCTGNLPVAQRPPLPFALSELLNKPGRTAAELRELALLQMERELQSQLDALPDPQLVYAVHNDFEKDRAFSPANKPRPIHVLIRGEIDKHGELVEPGTLSCVPELAGELEIDNPEIEGNRRAALARWLSHRNNALTWRTIVNRVWHYHFGQGLSPTPNDLGKMGGTPSHPDLLDWLAVWFRDEAKGSLKQLHRLIVTSDTYRQIVAHSPIAADKDPDNRLLWRMNRVRLTGEQLRDSLLQFAGRLDLTMGGPAVYQFRHKDVRTFQPSGGQPAFIDYTSFDPDDPANHRRSLYRFIFRTLPDPLMKAMDVPEGEQCMPVRTVSTTSVQAFALLNNPFVIRMSEHIAERVDGISAAFRLILQREPTSSELAKFKEYATKHGLANAVHLLLNSNEFIYVD